MNKRIRSVVALLGVCALIAAAAACSSYTGKEWRKSSGTSTVVVISVPDTNPHYLDGNTPKNNQEPWFVDAVEEAGAQWNTHPDLTVIVHVEDPGVRTCDLWRSAPATDWNCFEAWLEDNAHMGSHVPGSGGLAFRWANSTHYFNGPAESPARIEVANDWSGAGAREDIERRNAVCHEVGHMIGLEHAFPVDHDGDPNTPSVQPKGPCNGDAVIDKDPDEPYDQLGWDWQNTDDIYNVCENWVDGPPGAGPSELDDLSSGGYDSCGSGLTAESERSTKRSFDEARERATRAGNANKPDRVRSDAELEVVAD